MEYRFLRVQSNSVSFSIVPDALPGGCHSVGAQYILVGNYGQIQRKHRRTYAALPQESQGEFSRVEGIQSGALKDE